MVVPAVRIRQTLWLCVPRKFIGEVAEVGIQRRIPFDNFARVSGHAPEDRGHGAVGAVFRFIVGLVVADSREQVVVFHLVWIFGLVAETPGILAADDVSADVATAFGSDHM